MKTVIAMLIGLLLCGGCASHKKSNAKAPGATRQRFMPAPPNVATGGANWTPLQPMPGNPSGTLMAVAHAGIGETFPVAEAGGPRLFEVQVLTGDDLRLLVEVRAGDGWQRLELWRDQPVRFVVAERPYDLVYPSLAVSKSNPPVANKAMLLVHRLPEN